MTEWKRLGAIRPIPATQSLWDALRAAKAKGDRILIGDLSGQIRRATVEAGKERR
jgi:hypothetical protein